MDIEIVTDKQGTSYIAVPISKIEPENELYGDVFLKVNEKFIKFKNQGDILGSDKINFFISKNVKKLYILETSLPEFIDRMKAQRQQAIDDMTERVGEEHRAIVEANEEIKETIFETFTDEEINSDTVEILQEQVRNFVENTMKTDLSKAVLAKMVRHSESASDHAVNTANLAVFMGLILGHGNQKVLEDLYMGALLHDYAKLKIPPEILNNTTNSKYAQAIQDHPLRGAQAVKKLNKVSNSVLTIIAQHHEQNNGNGYPKGLKGPEIDGLAMVVNIANTIDNHVSANQRVNDEDCYRAAIKVLEYDRGKNFDHEILSKVITPLKLAYGGYQMD